MAKKRNGKKKKNGNNGSKSLGNSMYKLAKNASGYLAFASQLTAKDYSDLNSSVGQIDHQVRHRLKDF